MTLYIPLKKLVLISLTFCLVVAIFALGAHAANPGELRISYINVREGDAALIQAPENFNILIDGGRAYAEPTIVAYLLSQGARRIDLMVASHADSDHINGLTKILENGSLPVGDILYSGYGEESTPWAAFVTAAASQGITPTLVSYPAELSWGSLIVNVLNPSADLIDPEPNDASLVLKIEYGSIDFLFTGDIDTTVEATVIARGTPLAAEVLKVSHHGSKNGTGAEFLSAVQPVDAVISVGPNAYGHPAASVIQALESLGVQVWRTDQDGNILVVSDGMSYTVYKTHWIFLPFIQYNYGNQP